MLLTFSSRGSLPLGKMGERLQVHPTSVTSIVRPARGRRARRTHAGIPTTVARVLAEITDAGRALVERGDRATSSAPTSGSEPCDDQLRELSDLLRPCARRPATSERP